MLVFIGIYRATKRETEIPADEVHLKTDEKAGFNAFWAVICLMAILMHVNHYFFGLLEICYVLELIFIVGMFTFVVSRFYYLRCGFS